MNHTEEEAGVRARLGVYGTEVAGMSPSAGCGTYGTAHRTACYSIDRPVLKGPMGAISDNLESALIRMEQIPDIVSKQIDDNEGEIMHEEHSISTALILTGMLHGRSHAEV